MECLALDADRGFGEDSIPSKALHGSHAIQGKVAVRSEQSCHVQGCTRSSLLLAASLPDVAKVHRYNFQKEQLTLLNYGVTLTSSLWNKSVSCSLSRIVKVMVLEINFSSSFCLCSCLTPAFVAHKGLIALTQASLTRTSCRVPALGSLQLLPWTPYPGSLLTSEAPCRPLRCTYLMGLPSLVLRQSSHLSRGFQCHEPKRQRWHLRLWDRPAI